VVSASLWLTPLFCGWRMSSCGNLTEKAASANLVADPEASGGRRVDINLLYRPADRLGALEEEILNQVGQVCNVYPAFAIDVGGFHDWRG